MSEGDREDKTVVKRVSEVSGSTQAKAYMIVISGKSSGKMFPVDGNEFTIGRSEEADIAVDDEGVSRLHAKLVRLPTGEVRIIDLDSTNGSFFNGKKIEIHTLRDGDKIQIGSTTILKFSYQTDVEETFQRQQYESATKDGLTKIFNKKYFHDRFQGEFSYALRHRKILSLAIFDIDHFKNCNDTYGHIAGDYVLRHLATIVQDTVRNEDIFARVGGEEFAVILRDIDEQKGYIFGMRLLRLVERERFIFENQRIPLTISIGLATLSGGNFSTPQEMFKTADAYLYEAKRNGRNRVESIITVNLG
jgi:diguanylate cyclase (GGDEF)-like protein